MNRDRLQGISMQLSGVLKEMRGALNRNAGMAAQGARERLAGRILEQRALSKQAADRQIADFRNRNRNWLGLSKH